MNHDDLEQVDELLMLLDYQMRGHLLKGTFILSTGRTVQVRWDEETSSHCVTKSTMKEDSNNA